MERAQRAKDRDERVPGPGDDGGTEQGGPCEREGGSKRGRGAQRGGAADFPGLFVCRLCLCHGGYRAREGQAREPSSRFGCCTRQQLADPQHSGRRGRKGINRRVPAHPAGSARRPSVETEQCRCARSAAPQRPSPNLCRPVLAYSSIGGREGEYRGEGWRRGGGRGARWRGARCRQRGGKAGGRGAWGWRGWARQQAKEGVIQSPGTPQCAARAGVGAGVGRQKGVQEWWAGLYLVGMSVREGRSG